MGHEIFLSPLPFLNQPPFLVAPPSCGIFLTVPPSYRFRRYPSPPPLQKGRGVHTMLGYCKFSCGHVMMSLISQMQDSRPCNFSTINTFLSITSLATFSTQDFFL